MTLRRALAFGFLLTASLVTSSSQNASPAQVFGYRDFSKEAKIEEKFLAVPDAKLAGEHLKTLTAEPHLAGTPGPRCAVGYLVGAPSGA